MQRRVFLIYLSFFLFFPTLFASITGKKRVSITMHGDLDDDLFIIRSTEERTVFLECLQMHNPKDHFLYRSEAVKSRRIYGMIDFDKGFALAEDEALFVMTANEREEIHPEKRLFARTHFKSVDLLADGEVLIPSLMPERNDMPGYPLWFGPDEKPLMPNPEPGYNYYKLWENAVVNLGMVFGSTGRYRCHFINHDEEVVFTKEINVTKETQNIRLLGGHPLTEADGTLYDGTATDITTIRERAIEGVIVEKGGNSRYVGMPYPFPYVNRIFVRGL